MGNKKYARILLDDFVKINPSLSSLGSFGQTANHYKIWLIILDAHFGNQTISIKSIMNQTLNL